MGMPRLPRGGARLVLALAAGLLPMLFAAPVQASGYAYPQHHTWHVVVGVQSPNAGIQGMAFLPYSVWIDAGDTVVWTVATGEIHTVTFLARGQSRPAFNPSDRRQTTRQGGSSYDGRSYYNSGLMSAQPGMGSMGGYSMSGMGSGSGPASYRLTFGATGTFSYDCLVHSMMYGVVHVRRAGTPYPYSQAQYDAQAYRSGRALLDHGYYLANVAQRLSGNGTVVAGIGDGRAMVLRFSPYTIYLRVGQTLTFVNRDSETPHTVTFGTSSASTFAPYGNHAAFNGTSPLNSGYLGTDPHWFGTTFRVTFTRAGTFTYHCALHGNLGMYGRVVVIG